MTVTRYDVRTKDPRHIRVQDPRDGDPVFVVVSACDYDRALQEIEELKERLRRQPILEPFAWSTFDGEGGYDLRLYEDNENYDDEYVQRNGAKYEHWVDVLYRRIE